MVDQFTLKMLGALVLLGVAAALRFDRPSAARTFTTRGRFWFAGAAYICVYILTLLAAFVLVAQVTHVTGLDGAPRIPAHAGTAPLWIALGLALAALAWTPIETPLRKALHRFGGVPACAHALGQQLIVARFEPRPAVEVAARDMLRSRSIEVDRDWLDEAVPAQEQLLRAAAVYLELRAWRDERRLASFMDRVAIEVDHMMQRFDRLSIHASRMLACVEQVGEIQLALIDDSDRVGPQPAAVDAGCRALVSDLLVELCNSAANFHHDACHLLARGLVMSEAGARRRENRVKRMGFQLSEQAPVTGFAALGSVFAILLISVPAILALQGFVMKSALVITMVVAFSQTGALALGSIPKTRWGFANAGLVARAPPVFVAGAALVALLWGAIVNAAIGLLMGGMAGAVERLDHGWPYLPIAMLTAAGTAWLVQDFRWSAVDSSVLKRVRDALTMGLLWSIGGILTNGLKSWHHPVLLPPDWQASLGYSFAFGAALGAIVPGTFRDPLRRAPTPGLDPPRGPAIPARPASAMARS